MSVASSHRYETIYVLKSGLSESDSTAIHQKMDNVVQKFQGTLQTRDDWGLREMAYPIEKTSTGHYFVTVYSGTSGVVEEVERHFKISDAVIRFLTVMVDDQYDYTKVKKQIHAAEEEMKRNREARKKNQG